MVKVKDKDKRISKLKSAVIKILDVQSINYHLIVDILRELSYTEDELRTLGNCLRVLKKQGYIDERMTEGVRFWVRTSKVFDENPPVKVLVPFSAKTHKKIVDMAEKSGSTRVSIIRDLVRASLSSN